VPTETPPPYFPQNPLSPGDERTARKLRLTFYGCAVLLALALLAAIVGVVYLVRSLL
jgi:tetrahydromethanopterin S-methyltransferase subunit B